MTEATISATSRISAGREPEGIWDDLMTHRGWFWGSDDYVMVDGEQIASWEREDRAWDPDGTALWLSLGSFPAGPVALVDYPGHPELHQGFQVLADAFVTLDVYAAWSGVWVTSVHAALRQNGVPIATYSWAGGDPTPVVFYLEGVTARAGDIFTVTSVAEAPLFAFGSVSYVWAATHFKIVGHTMPGARKWLRGHGTVAATAV